MAPAMLSVAKTSRSQLLLRARLLLRRRLRVLLLILTSLFVFVAIVVLSPSAVEEGQGDSSMLEQESLARNDAPALATGIPKDKIPDYSVDQFNYVSTQDNVKQWKLLADKAFLYNKERIVHARTVIAYLYDPDGKATVVTGKEAKYVMNGKDLEIFGDVKTVFPDGFKTNSQYLHYRPQERIIHIPRSYFVSGGGDEQDGQSMSFESMGLDYAMGKYEIILPQAAKLTFTKVNSAPASSSGAGKGVPENTVIESDHCRIDRKNRVAYFTMYPDRPNKDRFVLITQPKLFARGRRADMNYGDYSKLLNYLVAYEDVTIKERQTGKSLKYATSGRADFDTKSDVVVLTEFPQVYQDDDTVAGDVIILHRDTDIVEVEHSNAFSEGSEDTHP